MTAGRRAFSRAVPVTRRHTVDGIILRPTFEPGTGWTGPLEVHGSLVEVLVEAASSGDRAHHAGALARDMRQMSTTFRRAFCKVMEGGDDRQVSGGPRLRRGGADAYMAAEVYLRASSRGSGSPSAGVFGQAVSRLNQFLSPGARKRWNSCSRGDGKARGLVAGRDITLRAAWVADLLYSSAACTF